MERSIAARYAARQTARFVTPSDRARERRLGLRGASSFRPASTRLTVVDRVSDGILARLRGDWRAVRPAPTTRAGDGRPRPVVRIRWSGSTFAGSTRRSRAATAPWRG